MDEFFDTLYESPLDRWFEIGSILTIIDAEMPEVLSAQMEYLLASEAACCGKLLLSKWQNVQEEALPVLTERILNHLNRALTGTSVQPAVSAEGPAGNGLVEFAAV